MPAESCGGTFAARTWSAAQWQEAEGSPGTSYRKEDIFGKTMHFIKPRNLPEPIKVKTFGKIMDINMFPSAGLEAWEENYVPEVPSVLYFAALVGRTAPFLNQANSSSRRTMSSFVKDTGEHL